MTSLGVLSFPSATHFAPPLEALDFAEQVPWRGILAVEPDAAVLAARSILLARSNYRVTPATGDGEVFDLRDTKAVALAILSDRLGRVLATVAATVRRQWPLTRILILGRVPMLLEDHLYDEQIDRSADPHEVLAALERLYEGMWNRRSSTLDWDSTRSVPCFSRPQLSESDPAKVVHAEPFETNLRGTPSDLRLTATRTH